MSTVEVKALALQLGSVVDVVEKRIDQAAQQSLRATQALDQQSRHSLETTNKLVQQALEQFRLGAKDAIAEGVRGAVRKLDQTVRDGADRLDQAVSQLNQHMQHVGRMNASHAWKTFIASALGSLAVFAVAVYASWHARADIKRSGWVQQIDAAVESGHLTTCPEGGLCVQAGNKWVRVGGK